MKTKLTTLLLLAVALAFSGCASFQTKVDNGIATFTKDVNAVAADVVVAGKATVAIGGDVVTVATGIVKSTGTAVLPGVPAAPVAGTTAASGPVTP